MASLVVLCFLLLMLGSGMGWWAGHRSGFNEGIRAAKEAVKQVAEEARKNGG